MIRRAGVCFPLAMLLLCLLAADGRSTESLGSSSATCKDLWHRRNAIFARNGYCFENADARAIFPSSCFPPYGRLSKGDMKEVARLAAEEVSQGCEDRRKSAQPEFVFGTDSVCSLKNEAACIRLGGPWNVLSLKRALPDYEIEYVQDCEGPCISVKHGGKSLLEIHGIEDKIVHITGSAATADFRDNRVGDRMRNAVGDRAVCGGDAYQSCQSDEFPQIEYLVDGCGEEFWDVDNKRVAIPDCAVIAGFALSRSVTADVPVHDKAVPLESDKTIASVGSWTISTALYGVGCVAHLGYDESGELSISGEAKDRLALLVTVDRSLFDTPLDGSSDDLSNVEVALVGKRWGGIEPYGYRGTAGVVLQAGSDFLDQFKSSKQLKIIERGKERLSIPLGNANAVILALDTCFHKSQSPP